MSTQQSLVKATEDKASKFTEFTPFGSQDKIKLSVTMIQSLIAVKTKSGKTCSELEAIKFIAMCQARRLNPFEGDAFLIGYDGKDGPSFSLITAHQAFLKRAEMSNEYDGMKSGIIVQNDDDTMQDMEGDFFMEGQELLGGWATVYFKNRSQPMHKRIRLKRFQKSWGIWQEDPAGMICKCAEADALRSSFPTMLGGLYLREEMSAVPETKMATPIFGEQHITKPLLNRNPEPSQKEMGILEQVKVRCQAAKIDEATLIDFLGAIGLSDGETSLDDLPETSLGMCLEQWEDFEKRIKEVE